MRRKREQTMAERFLQPRGAVHPPASRKVPVPRWIVAGVVRLFLWVLLAAGLAIGIALLIGTLTGSNPSRSIPVGLYRGGAARMVVSLGGMGAFGSGNIYRLGRVEGASSSQTMRQFQAGRGAYIIVGFLLVALGVLFDWLL
jgi:hypothetical protein